MRYSEYEPPEALSPWIKLFWVFESRSSDQIPETIVADGHPELIVHFRSSFLEIGEDGKQTLQPAAITCGQLTRPLVLQSSSDAGMIGIRFQPCGMAPFISSPMKCLTDARVPASELFVEIDRLADDVMDSSNDKQRVAACVRFLMSSLDAGRDDITVRHALDRIVRSRGNISVEALATLTGKSRRSLELAFQKAVGTSPKMYCRITRFRHLYDLVSDLGPNADWVQTALDSGFFDQSHLIRDFRRFAGESPTSFLANQTPFAQSVN